MEMVNGGGGQKGKVERGERSGVWGCGGVQPVEVRPTALQREHGGLKSMCC